MMRTRQIVQMANAHGKPCDMQGSLEVTECNMQGCDCVDCEFGEWSEWSAPTCTGLCERHRSIKTHYKGCGKPCEGPKVVPSA